MPSSLNPCSGLHAGSCQGWVDVRGRRIVKYPDSVYAHACRSCFFIAASTGWQFFESDVDLLNGTGNLCTKAIWTRFLTQRSCKQSKTLAPDTHWLICAECTSFLRRLRTCSYKGHHISTWAAMGSLFFGHRKCMRQCHHRVYVGSSVTFCALWEPLSKQPVDQGVPEEISGEIRRVAWNWPCPTPQMSTVDSTSLWCQHGVC